MCAILARSILGILAGTSSELCERGNLARWEFNNTNRQFQYSLSHSFINPSRPVPSRPALLLITFLTFSLPARLLVQTACSWPGRSAHPCVRHALDRRVWPAGKGLPGPAQPARGSLGRRPHRRRHPDFAYAAVWGVWHEFRRCPLWLPPSVDSGEREGAASAARVWPHTRGIRPQGRSGDQINCAIRFFLITRLKWKTKQLWWSLFCPHRCCPYSSSVRRCLWTRPRSGPEARSWTGRWWWTILWTGPSRSGWSEWSDAYHRRSKRRWSQCTLSQLADWRRRGPRLPIRQPLHGLLSVVVYK